MFAFYQASTEFPLKFLFTVDFLILCSYRLNHERKGESPVILAAASFPDS